MLLAKGQVWGCIDGYRLGCYWLRGQVWGCIEGYRLGVLLAKGPGVWCILEVFGLVWSGGDDMNIKVWNPVSGRVLR